MVSSGVTAIGNQKKNKVAATFLSSCTRSSQKDDTDIRFSVTNSESFDAVPCPVTSFLSVAGQNSNAMFSSWNLQISDRCLTPTSQKRRCYGFVQRSNTPSCRLDVHRCYPPRFSTQLSSLPFKIIKHWGRNWKAFACSLSWSFWLYGRNYKFILYGSRGADQSEATDATWKN